MSNIDIQVKAKIDDENMKLAKELFEQGLSYEEIMKQVKFKITLGNKDE